MAVGSRGAWHNRQVQSEPAPFSNWTPTERASCVIETLALDGWEEGVSKKSRKKKKGRAGMSHPIPSHPILRAITGKHPCTSSAFPPII